MSRIRHHKNSAMYKGIVLTLALSQISQTVWTSPHPLLPEIATVPPFDLSDDSNSRGDSSAAASSSSSDEISFEQQQQQQQQHELKNGGGGNKETREIHSRPQPGVGDRLCSLFRTFLEARRVNCGYSNNIKNRHLISPFQIQSEDQAERMFLHERMNQNQNHNSNNNNNNNNNPNNPNNNNNNSEDDDDDDDVSLVESNNLIPPPLHRSQILSSDLDDSTDPRLQNIPPVDENGEPLDETKIIRSKTMIIVPERPCPLGKRRDIHGYCRTIINLNRFQPYTSSPPRNGPVRFYYRRYVQVPTLHFILP